MKASSPPSPTRAALSWRDLPTPRRALLRSKLCGLYNRQDDGAAFNSLSTDRQQALFLFLRRFEQLGLWRCVLRVTNVYGMGGVGLGFTATADLPTLLHSRREFTTWFAARRSTSGIGFYERGRARAALHILRSPESEDCWAAHFDLYCPVATPASFARHLLHEVCFRRTPDWRIVQRDLP